MSDQNVHPRRAVVAYVGVVVAVGVGVLIPRAQGMEWWAQSDVLSWVALTLAIVVAEQFSIPLRHRTETVNFSLTDGLWAAALPLARADVLTFAVAAGVLLGHVVNRRAPLKIAFNVGQFVIGITAAELVFSGLPHGSILEPPTWLAVATAMSAYFVLNANLVVGVVAIAERKSFTGVLGPSLPINVLHWAGNTALGILGSIVWVTSPAGLPLLAIPIVLSYLAYRQWIRGVRERDQMRGLYEAGCALAGPLDEAGDFAPFLELLEQMLEADAVELVVLSDGVISVHSPGGTRMLAPAGEDRGRTPLDAFVRVHEGLPPQIALIGGREDAKGVLAVYRRESLTPTERSLLEALASQISVRLRNHELFFQTFEQAQLAEIVAHTSDGIFVVAHDHRVLSWNPAMERITGFTAEDVTGRRFDDVFGGSVLTDEVIGETLDPTRANGEPHDSLLSTKQGERRWVRHSSTPIRDREGAPRAVVVVAHDVTSQVQTEQMKKDFVAMVSHELRTPLTPLKGFLKTLMEGTADASPEARQEYYRIMQRQADRLERLIMDLLDVSQIESGTLVVVSRPVEITTLVTEQVAEFRGQHTDRAISVTDTCGLTLAMGDPFRIQQVVSNLVSNALKYSPSGSPVDVRIGMIGGRATIAVSDRGPGILLPDPDLVFERFFRAQDLDGRVGGAGLGLYIARQLVEAMGGRLWVTSRPGEGSTFSFTLPGADVLSVAEPVPNGRAAATARPTAG